MTTTDLARPGPGDAAPEDSDDIRTSQTPPEPTETPRGSGRRRFVLGLSLIALAGLVVRVVYVLGWKNPGPAYGDALYYHWGANYLADGEGYLHPLQLLWEGLRIPGADHPPGYMTVLAAFSLVGLQTFLQHQLVSCLLGTAGVVAMGLAGRRIGGERVGYLVALATALSPNVWFHDAAVMSETLVVGTTGAVLLTAYRWWDRRTLEAALWFGAAVGVAGLVRSEALLLGPAIALPLAVGAWRRAGGDDPTAVAARARAIGLQVAAAGGLAVLLLAPWAVYNLTRFEHPVPLSAQFDHTLVAANCDDVYYGPNTGYWSRRCVEAVEPLTDPLDDASEEAVVYRRLTRDYLGNHTERATQVVGLRVLRTFGLYQQENQLDLDRQLDSKEKGLGQVGLLSWYLVAVAGVFGLFIMRRAGRAIFPIVALVGVTALTVAVTYGATRFRLPAELALFVPAAVSVDTALAAWSRRRTRRAEAAEAADARRAVAGADTDVPAGLGSSGGRFAGFDGLRAVAALGVLLTHVALASGFVGRSSSGRYLSRADVGVALFFALSGFLLYRPFVSARMDQRAGLGVRRYLRHRFLRIFPAYWLALTVLAVVLDVRGRADIHNPWDFVRYYGLFQSYSNETALGGLQQAWTLTNEMSFYLLLPLWAAAAVWLAGKVRPKAAVGIELGVLALAGAAAVGWGFYLHSVQTLDPATGRFDARTHWIFATFHLFVPGMMLALLYEWSRRRDRPLRGLELIRRHPLVCWGLAALCFWAVSTRIGMGLQVGPRGAGQYVQHQLLYALIGILLMAPIALAGTGLPRSLRWLSTRVMVTLGVLSYGIYLWHEGITDIYMDRRGLQFFQGDFVPELAVVLLGSVAAAALSYVLLERPALGLKDRDGALLRGWRPLGLPPDALLEPRPSSPAPSRPSPSADGDGDGDGAAQTEAEASAEGTVEAEPEPASPARRSARERLARLPAWVVPAGIIGVVVALPFWGLWIAPGPPMEEGFMLVFPERVLAGDIPNRDFLHLYGPGSLWVLAGFFRVLGTHLWVERLVGFLQVAALIAGTTVVGWRWGRWTAAVAGAVTAIMIMPPIQFTALAWVGGVALALWAVIVAVRVHDPPDGNGRRSQRTLLVAGLLAGGALLFRPDLIVALALPFGALWLWGLDRAQRKQLLLGLAAGVSPYLAHLVLAGPGNAITGMVLEPIFELRPGRSLPFPPPTDSLASFLNRAFVWRAWPWPFPALDEPQQVFVWVFILFAVCAVLVGVGIQARRAGSPNGWRLLALGLLAVGTLPQTIQRADTAHLAWVSCVPFGLLPSALAEWGRLRDVSARARVALLLTPLAVMFAVIPHYTIRWYADYVGQSFGYRRDGHEIANDGRVFYYGRGDVAAAANELLADVDRVTEPGQRLIVGTGDLRRTSYSEAYLYFLLPQLDPGTRYIEMDPGMANTADSGLADELRDTDVVILSTVYDDWEEPNTSTDYGSDEPNQVVAQDFCLYQSYGSRLYLDGAHRGLYELYLRCDDGDRGTARGGDGADTRG